MISKLMGSSAKLFLFRCEAQSLLLSWRVLSGTNGYRTSIRIKVNYSLTVIWNSGASNDDVID